MSFENFLNQAWNDHASQPEQVAERLPQGLKLLEKEEQIPQMAHLIAHVMGEHLGRWGQGSNLLKELTSSLYFKPNSEGEKSIARLTASLSLASGDDHLPAGFSLSDQVRTLAVAASALSGRNQISRAKSVFMQALSIAQTGLEKGDPANRALAVTGNNLACALEEKTEKDAADIDLMIIAAKTGRKYWEISGGSKEIQIAEYRLSMTYIQAGDFQKAFEHAQSCIEIGEANTTGPFDMFYGFEALAYAEQARKNQVGYSKAIEKVKFYFEQLSPENQSLCEKNLQKLLQPT